MVQSQKYARVERERRFLLAESPPELAQAPCRRIEDLYITASRLRLRKVVSSSGEIEYKLTQKIDDDATHRVVTSIYLTAQEYARLSQLPGKRLTKCRYDQFWKNSRFGIDVFDEPLDGLVLAEIEAASDVELDAIVGPPVMHVEVTDRTEFTGGVLARTNPATSLALARSLLSSGPRMPNPAQLAIRELQPADPPALARVFSAMNKAESQYHQYLIEQSAGKRVVLVALYGDDLVGYVTIVWAPEYAPFRAAGIPEIQDLNVVASQRRRGIATALLDEAETLIAQRSPIVGIGVGLHSGYNAAQRLYVLRGYVPDGHGVVHGTHFVQDREFVSFDDDLVLHLTKRL
jgi:CYTH domain-containing protein/GNAT superfamily N-acetyltransferase